MFTKPLSGEQPFIVPLLSEIAALAAGWKLPFAVSAIPRKEWIIIFAGKSQKMRLPILGAIKQHVLLSDGAMGTQLQQAGLKPGECGELWNVEAPEKVKEIQKRYADAGSDMILTNTFGGSRIALARHGLGDRTAEINEAAARLAREVMGENHYVVGDLGPYGGMMEPHGDDESADVEESFFEQARGLLRGGVDALIVETQTAIEEATCGVRACKMAIDEAGQTGKIPVIVSFAFDHNANGPPKTMMGVDPERAADEMGGLGIDIIAANCGTKLDIKDYIQIVEIYAKTLPQTPIMAQPNAGSPEMEKGKVVYRETPAMMAQGVRPLVEAGAVIVGGCCGTTPEHIALFRKALSVFNDQTKM